MSKFQVGDRVDTGHWGIVTVKEAREEDNYFYADYNYDYGFSAGEGLFHDNRCTLVDSAVSRAVAAERNEDSNIAQLDRIERLLRFQINRFYGVVMDDDGTFRKTGVLPEFSNQ